MRTIRLDKEDFHLRLALLFLFNFPVEKDSIRFNIHVTHNTMIICLNKIVSYGELNGFAS